MRLVLWILGVLAVLAVLVVGAFFWAISLPAPLAVPEPGVSLSDVTIINPGVDRAERRSIRVEDGVIVSIGAALAPSDAFAGHFVLPGLADAHVHFPPAALPGQGELFSFLFLYHGVTVVRDAGDLDGTSTRPVVDAIEARAFPGPRIFSCGPFVDGPGGIWGNTLTVETPDDARRAADAVADAGFDCVKAYNELVPETLAALKKRAAERGLPVIGHVPWRMTYETAALDDVQHMTAVAPPLADPTIRFPDVMAAWPTIDEARIREIAGFSVDHGVVNTPTLVVTDRGAAAVDFDSVRTEPDVYLLPRFYRDVIWSPTEGTLRGRTAAQYALLDAARSHQRRAVKGLYDAGATLRTGTDVLNPFVVPGASLHRELHILVEAGLSPTQALALSRDTANALGGGRLGFLEAGAPADLLVFSADPTADLSALATLAAVVVDGRLYTRRELDTQLAAYQEKFSSAPYEAVTLPLVRRALAGTTRGR